MLCKIINYSKSNFIIFLCIRPVFKNSLIRWNHPSLIQKWIFYLLNTNKPTHFNVDFSTKFISKSESKEDRNI